MGTENKRLPAGLELAHLIAKQHERLEEISRQMVVALLTVRGFANRGEDVELDVELPPVIQAIGDLEQALAWVDAHQDIRFRPKIKLVGGESDA